MVSKELATYFILAGLIVFLIGVGALVLLPAYSYGFFEGMSIGLISSGFALILLGLVVVFRG
jgi:hypothetical protein